MSRKEIMIISYNNCRVNNSSNTNKKYANDDHKSYENDDNESNQHPRFKCRLL